MKSFIALASLTAAVFAADGRVTSVKSVGCAHDNCLRNVIASHLTGRPGYADCVSWLLTTVIPTSETKWETVYTLSTTTATTATITQTEDFTTPPPVPPVQEQKRNVGYIKYIYPKEEGFKKVKRQATSTPITITNSPPSYVSTGCVDLGGTRNPIFRYSSACACVGVTAGDPFFAAQGTITSVQFLPSSETTSTVSPTETKTAYALKASVSGGPAVASGKYLASSTFPASSAWLIAATGVAAATAPTLVVYPDGKTTFGGKLIVARQSSYFPDVSFLELVPDSQPIPAINLPVVCQINQDYTITCKSPSTSGGVQDRSRLFLTGGGVYSLRLVKEGSTPPADFFPLSLKPLSPS
ncbi:hypothetical protein TWF506_010053 [Arthrobotrys conoides]|uniref:Uncharacterized protein n=1 Tax=Arthrobotrys conoides TaxID=74498 RepID=A0AAN8N397_9PEZI